jgi:hypothetical protein
MKINFADSTREPSLKSLHQIMLEVAIDAREEQKKIASDIQQAIQLQLIKVKREFQFKK